MWYRGALVLSVSSSAARARPLLSFKPVSDRKIPSRYLANTLVCIVLNVIGSCPTLRRTQKNLQQDYILISFKDTSTWKHFFFQAWSASNNVGLAPSVGLPVSRWRLFFSPHSFFYFSPCRHGGYAKITFKVRVGRNKWAMTTFLELSPE